MRREARHVRLPGASPHDRVHRDTSGNEQQTISCRSLAQVYCALPASMNRIEP
jgi:hypothetical protein